MTTVIMGIMWTGANGRGAQRKSLASIRDKDMSMVIYIRQYCIFGVTIFLLSLPYLLDSTRIVLKHIQFEYSNKFVLVVVVVVVL